MVRVVARRGSDRGLTAVAIVAAMATQSLYRRYRPRRFSELKGQDHVVRALRTSVAEGREGQAYLFSGPRGTGKTTSARILAKVLNCENPRDGEPCCECESCLAVERGVSYDVHELDAASNNGVDAMRDLIEKSSLGTPGRHKVYILDEVHMLSKAAEAALLKTLEEPPPHVVFVLATTDPQKMSDTIRSRTQHLQFHLLPADTLAEHVRWVAADAGLDVSDAAFEQALSRGGGSARDTLSALELVANTGDEGMDVVPLDEFVEAMIDRDSGRALTVVAHAISSGMDARTLTEELIGIPPQRVPGPDGPGAGAGAVEPSRRARRTGAASRRRRARARDRVAGCRHWPRCVTPPIRGCCSMWPRCSSPPTASATTPPASWRASSASSVRWPAGVGRSGRVEASGSDQPGHRSSRARRAGAGGGRRCCCCRPRRRRPTPRRQSRRSRRGCCRNSRSRGSGGTWRPASAGRDPAVELRTSAAQRRLGRSRADAWENTIRPALRGMARAVYAPATFVRSSDSTLTLSVPNAVHRAKCEEQRTVVEAALAKFAGSGGHDRTPRWRRRR